MAPKITEERPNEVKTLPCYPSRLVSRVDLASQCPSPESFSARKSTASVAPSRCCGESSALTRKIASKTADDGIPEGRPPLAREFERCRAQRGPLATHHVRVVRRLCRSPDRARGRVAECCGGAIRDTLRPSDVDPTPELGEVKWPSVSSRRSEGSTGGRRHPE